MSAAGVLATASVNDAVITTRDTFQSTLTNIVEFLPRLVVALLILLVGWLVAKSLARAANAILERVGFDRAVERGGIKQALARSKYDASDIVAKFVYYALMLFVLQLTFGVFGPNPISELLTRVIAFIPSIIVAIIIVVIAAAIAAAVKNLIQNTLGGLSYGRLLGNIASVFILGLGIIAALNQVGIATTVTLPVLIAVLATVSGVVIVGAGGGLIRPMQQRWESYLSRAEAEAPRIQAQAQASPSASTQVRAQAAQAGTSRDVPFDNAGGARRM